MDVTVIISAYKDRGYLDECIKSVLGQSFARPYQIILSSDGNGELSSFATKYGLDFVLSEKMNHSTALNNAIKASRGVWIKEVHDDDLLTKDSLRNLWDAKGAGDIVYGNAEHVRNGRSFRTHKSPQSVNIKSFLPVMTNPVHGGTLFFKRDVFLAVGGLDPNMQYAEEYEFYFNLLSHGYIFEYCDSVVALYRVHNEQQTRYFTTPIVNQTRQYIQNKYRAYLSKV